MRFFKTVLAVIVGFFVAITVMLFFVIMVGSAMGGSTDSVEENSILVLDFDEQIPDFNQKTVIEDFGFENDENKGLNLVIQAIKYAKEDKKIKGISLKSVDGIQGYAQLAEVRKALEDFKTSGKFIYAFNENISQRDYFLQSVADSVFLGTLGEVGLRGLSTEILYYKDFEDKFGVKYEVFRHGKYKSAVEPYLENKMSEANREQNTELLNSLWENYRKTVSESRNIAENQLDIITDSLWGRTPELALKNRLVDAILFQDQYEELLRKQTQTSQDKDLNFVKIGKYIKYFTEKNLLSKKEKDLIAVIYAEGAIMDGKSSFGVVGDETIIQALRQVRKDDKVKAVVLRVNSPGGSGLASELMHRELELTKQVKPIYVSMGNYAASGGYYISCNATKIFANPQTITGSIGVFAMIPNVKGLADKLGVNAQQVSTHHYASGYMGYSIFENTPESTRKVVTQSIEHFYNKFIERVAQGRNLTTEQVDKIAQGRVWTGAEAKKIGLVDDLATLEQVIEFAAQQNDLQAYSVKNYPVLEISFEDLFKNKIPFMSVEQLIENEVGKENYQLWKKLKAHSEQRGIQARLPFDMEIK